MQVQHTAAPQTGKPSSSGGSGSGSLKRLRGNGDVVAPDSGGAGFGLMEGSRGEAEGQEKGCRRSRAACCGAEATAAELQRRRQAAHQEGVLGEAAVASQDNDPKQWQRCASRSVSRSATGQDISVVVGGDGCCTATEAVSGVHNEANFVGGSAGRQGGKQERVTRIARSVVSHQDGKENQEPGWRGKEAGQQREERAEGPGGGGVGVGGGHKELDAAWAAGPGIPGRGPAAAVPLKDGPTVLAGARRGFKAPRFMGRG